MSTYLYFFVIFLKFCDEPHTFSCLLSQCLGGTRGEISDVMLTLFGEILEAVRLIRTTTQGGHDRCGIRGDGLQKPSSTPLLRF